MNFTTPIKTCLRKYVQFDGRASHREFWFFVLFLAIIHAIGQNTEMWEGNNFTFRFGLTFGLGTPYDWWTNIYTAIFTVSLIAALCRRLHNVGIGGHYIFVAPFAALIIALIGLKIHPAPLTAKYLFSACALILFGLFLYFTVKKSRPGQNAYGPNPHEVSP